MSFLSLNSLFVASVITGAAGILLGIAAILWHLIVERTDRNPAQHKARRRATFQTTPPAQPQASRAVPAPRQINPVAAYFAMQALISVTGTCWPMTPRDPDWHLRDGQYEYPTGQLAAICGVTA